MEEIQYLKDKSLGPGIFAVDRNLREGLWTSWTGLTKVSDMQLKCPENFQSLENLIFIYFQYLWHPNLHNSHLFV